VGHLAGRGWPKKKSLTAPNTHLVFIFAPYTENKKPTALIKSRRNSMKTHSKTRYGLAALGVAAVLLVPAAYAQQGPDSGPPPPGGFGGPGGPGGFGGGRGGGRGGFGGRMPFATGTVTAVNVGAGTVTVTSPFGGQSQTIQTQGTTTISTQTTASVSDLKVGDKVQVSGVPTGITASRVTIGDSPLTPPGGGPGGPGGFGGRPGGGPGSPGGPGAAPAQAFATGTVSSLNPLTLKLSDTVSMTLKMDTAAKVTKYATTALSAVKVGDQVVATGQSNDDGSFSATTLGVNVDMGGGGGGFGGRGGGGGFGQGGPGGFGGGGFGGGGRRGGGRRGGGGQGGPPQGGPGGGGFGGPGADGPPPDGMPQ